MNRLLSFRPLIAGLMTCAMLSLATSIEAQNKKLSMQDIYNQAVADFESGKLDRAEKGFEIVLKANPKYVYAKKYLISIKQKRQAGATSVSIEPKVQQIVLPSVEFSDASLTEVLAYLSKKGSEATSGAFVPNFVYRGTAEQGKILVTLKLSNVPMTDVIRYVGELTGTAFEYDAHAIIGIPVGGKTAFTNRPEKAPAELPDTFD